MPLFKKSKKNLNHVEDQDAKNDLAQQHADLDAEENEVNEMSS